VMAGSTDSKALAASGVAGSVTRRTREAPAPRAHSAASTSSVAVTSPERSAASAIVRASSKGRARALLGRSAAAPWRASSRPVLAPTRRAIGLGRGKAPPARPDDLAGRHRPDHLAPGHQVEQLAQGGHTTEAVLGGGGEHDDTVARIGWVRIPPSTGPVTPTCRTAFRRRAAACSPTSARPAAQPVTVKRTLRRPGSASARVAATSSPTGRGEDEVTLASTAGSRTIAVPLRWSS
jgi:hypothetical protein